LNQDVGFPAANDVDVPIHGKPLRFVARLERTKRYRSPLCASRHSKERKSSREIPAFCGKTADPRLRKQPETDHTGYRVLGARFLVVVPPGRMSTGIVPCLQAPGQTVAQPMAAVPPEHRPYPTGVGKPQSPTESSGAMPLPRPAAGPWSGQSRRSRPPRRSGRRRHDPYTPASGR